MRPLKIPVKLALRGIRDIWSGDARRFARAQNMPADYPFCMSLRQEIKPGPAYDNKVYNLQRAAMAVNRYHLAPDEILSFWRMVGNPNRGFRESRSIHNGQVRSETGGGLCQVSGILYYLGILANMDILERHAHSIDLYTEATRFTPLGADATVVYGYKDLRMRNSLGFPLRFVLKVEENTLLGELWSAQEIFPRELVFEKEEEPDRTRVRVTDTEGRLVNHSSYQKLPQ